MVVLRWRRRKRYQRQVPLRTCAVPGGVHQAADGTRQRGSRASGAVRGRPTTVDGREAPSNAVHHSATERASGRVVQQEVRGEVGVEQIIEHVLRDLERYAGPVVGIQMRHGEHVDANNVPRSVGNQKHDRHDQQYFGHLKTK